MVIDEVRSKLVVKKTNILQHELIPHEKVSLGGINKLEDYINNFHSEIILPSILVCNKTNVIIDGHHRLHVIKLLEVDQIPVSLIDYNSDLILTDEKNSLSKKEIISSAKNNKLFPPITSKHLINFKEHSFPLIIISDLRIIN